MMIFVLIILFVLGAQLTLLLKSDIDRGLLVGVSFPFGFGVWSVLLFLIDNLGVAINNKLILLIACSIMLSIFTGLLWRRRAKYNAIVKPFHISKFFLRYKNNPILINPFYITLLIIVGFIVFVIVSKTLYWPIMNYDSIDGYDLIAKLIGAEGHYNNAVFSTDNPIHTVRSFYPPILVHVLSISYVFEGVHSKFTAVLYLMSTLIVLYYLVLRTESHVAAIFSVFLLCIVPEFMGQSALTASNPLSACYMLICLGFFDQYLKSKDRGHFYISMMALSFTIWTRTEAVIFAVPLFLLLINGKQIKSSLPKLGMLSLFTLVPFITWQLFIKKLSVLSTSQPIIKRLFFDSEKLLDLLGQIKIIVFNTEIYALGFFFILIAIITNLIFYKKTKHIHKLTLILVISFIMYVWVYYQLDTDYKVIHKGSWIGSGFKRGLFYFIPIGCYYIGKSFLVQKLFVKINLKE